LAGLIGAGIMALESGLVFGLRSLWGYWSKAHELYAVVAFAGLGIGGLCLGICMLQSRLGGGASWHSGKVLLPSAAFASMVASTLALLATYIISYISPELRNARGGLYFLLNFGFWEWVAAASLIALLVAMTAHERPEREPRANCVSPVRHHGCSDQPPHA
jgi:hypothetical protein